MKKLALISPFLIGALLIQGCASHGALDKVGLNCPAPSQDQLDEMGFFMLQKGVTMKCQVMNYTKRSGKSCVETTDGTDDGWVCDDWGKKIVFVFDENGKLKDRKTY